MFLTARHTCGVEEIENNPTAFATRKIKDLIVNGGGLHDRCWSTQQRRRRRFRSTWLGQDEHHQKSQQHHSNCGRYIRHHRSRASGRCHEVAASGTGAEVGSVGRRRLPGNADNKVPMPIRPPPIHIHIIIGLINTLIFAESLDTCTGGSSVR